jgi:hypothetical protein
LKNAGLDVALTKLNETMQTFLKITQPLFGFIVAVLCFTPIKGVAAQYEWAGVSRIVAVGDIHGDYDNYREALLQAGLTNPRGNWIAGDTHLVQLGDLPDRGADTDKVISHIKKLQRQAIAAGGKVHALVGNHEAMNMMGDLRYVHPGEYSALRTGKSRQLRAQYYTREVERLSALDVNFVADKEFLRRWQATYPLGYVEHRQAWLPTGEVGSWVLANSAIVKINRNLFVHGGVSPSLLSLSIAQINEQIKAELNGDIGEESGLSESDDGPLWYRGLASNSQLQEAAHVDAVLQAYGVDRIIIGHTPGHGIILPRFEGKVIIVDTGISQSYGGHIASLLLEENAAFAIQAQQKLALPTTEHNLLPYLEQAAALATPTTALVNLIESLKKAATQTSNKI